MSAVHLLDGSVLIAGGAAEHPHHRRVVRWLAQRERVALCPVTEGALVRFVIREGGSVAGVQEAVSTLRRRGAEFWPDDLSYAEADLRAVRGHRQVTDAYLVALSAARGGVLATLDEGLVRSHPEHTLLIPSA
jgi:predicted nucleic acid-binding protein